VVELYHDLNINKDVEYRDWSKFMSHYMPSMHIMPYCLVLSHGNKKLLDIIKNNTQIVTDFEYIQQAGVQICESLQHMHTRGIIHSNVTSSHVVVGRDGHHRLCGMCCISSICYHSCHV